MTKHSALIGKTLTAVNLAKDKMAIKFDLTTTTTTWPQKGS